jgi:hypothetical protein
MRKLPNDFTRCGGKGCQDRNRCLRFLELQRDVARRPKTPIQRYSIRACLADESGRCVDRLLVAA